MYNIFRLWLTTPPPPPWLPTELNNLKGWWVPDGMNFVTGASITSLASTGGINNTLTQTTTAKKPVYGLLGGRGAIDFDGVDDSLLMDDLSITNAANAITMFFLFKLDDIATDVNFKHFMLFPTSGGASTRLFFALNSTSGALKNYGFAYRNSDISTSTFAWSNTPADTGAHVIVASFDRSVTPTHFDIFLDGNNIYSANTVSPSGTWDATNGSAPIVGNRTTNLAGIDGKMSNFGVCRSIPSSGERQKLEGYLSWFGGIQSQLPSGHPYRAAPPAI